MRRHLKEVFPVERTSRLAVESTGGNGWGSGNVCGWKDREFQAEGMTVERWFREQQGDQGGWSTGEELRLSQATLDPRP